MKVATWKGCKDCPYSDSYICHKFDIAFNDADVSSNPNLWPHIPHPNCKLNDLPTNSEIIDFKTGDPNADFNDGFISGANYILNKINGS